MKLVKRECGLVAVAVALAVAALGASAAQAAPLSSGSDLKAVAGSGPGVQPAHWEGRYYRHRHYYGYYRPRYEGYYGYRSYRPHYYYGYAPRYYGYYGRRHHHW
jgi:hypothetical protein